MVQLKLYCLDFFGKSSTANDMGHLKISAFNGNRAYKLHFFRKKDIGFNDIFSGFFMQN